MFVDLEQLMASPLYTASGGEFCVVLNRFYRWASRARSIEELRHFAMVSVGLARLWMAGTDQNMLADYLASQIDS